MFALLFNALFGSDEEEKYRIFKYPVLVYVQNGMAKKLK
jgi:hypothetical protein